MDIETKLNEARAKANELWSRLKVIEDETKPALQACEEARHAWYLAQHRVETLEEMAKELEAQ